jgi:hypothetical protein
MQSPLVYPAQKPVEHFNRDAPLRANVSACDHQGVSTAVSRRTFGNDAISMPHFPFPTELQDLIALNPTDQNWQRSTGKNFFGSSIFDYHSVRADASSRSQQVR